MVSFRKFAYFSYFNLSTIEVKAEACKGAQNLRRFTQVQTTIHACTQCNIFAVKLLVAVLVFRTKLWN